jgi:BirA family biotin operon repressor/biotin-[acetyl-CoA-carboxylase] ligase
MRELLKFNKVTSTQDVVKRFIKNNKELAVFALCQTKGRGRHKRVWFSPPGGLYLSILVYPKRRINTIPLIPCLAVIETLKEFGIGNLTIHWPNDVNINRKKVCGILCERVDDAIICGIGLNVNIKDFPSRLPDATSMYIESGVVYNLDEVLDHLLKNFWSFYDALQNDTFNLEYAFHYVDGIGEPVEVILSSKERLSGIIHNIDEDWGLLIRTEEGVMRKIYYGDVVRLS